MDEQKHFRIDDVYKNMPLEGIPWNMETPPELLVELVDSGKVYPCKAVDLDAAPAITLFILPAEGSKLRELISPRQL